MSKSPIDKGQGFALPELRVGLPLVAQVRLLVPSAGRMRVKTKSKQSGFSLTELMAVTAIMVLLALISPSVLGTNRNSSKSVRCLSNYKQLQLAWMAYASDNQGRLAMNVHGGEAVGGGVMIPGRTPWAVGWLDWSTRTDNINHDFLKEPRFSSLGTYTHEKTSIYKCPSDTYISNAQAAAGWTNRVRSVSMNATVGFSNPLIAPWDPEIYRKAVKIGDLKIPSPAETFVFIDEHPDSINDPMFYVPSTGLVDVPAGLHRQGATVSFADGRAEIHKWRRPSARTQPSRNGLYVASSGDQDDIRWLRYRSQRNMETDY